LVVKEEDKSGLSDPGLFGYNALQHLVKLSNKVSGARYDDLKELVCEIQVQTILQDVWAIVDRHLRYKNESAVPDILKRKLNALEGLFETANDQFDKINIERLRYRTAVGAGLEEVIGSELLTLRSAWVEITRTNTRTSVNRIARNTLFRLINCPKSN